MTKVVAGNWKMHMGPRDTRAFFGDFSPGLDEDGDPTVIVFPPAISIQAAVSSPDRDPTIAIGVQSLHWEDSGAFTGEISAPMAVEAGAAYALVGHSERRHLFGETDEEVGRKVAAALRHALIPVICVGETLEERRAGRMEEVVLRQLDAALDGVGKEAVFVVAYEPVWAIGTGETATPDDASRANGTLRKRVGDHLGPRAAGAVPILYGGSVKPENAVELMASPGVDGVLVGGASLHAVSFARIVDAGRE